MRVLTKVQLTDVKATAIAPAFRIPDLASANLTYWGKDAEDASGMTIIAQAPSAEIAILNAKATVIEILPDAPPAAAAPNTGEV